MPPETITRKAPMANSPGTTMALARSTRLLAVKKLATAGLDQQADGRDHEEHVELVGPDRLADERAH